MIEASDNSTRITGRMWVGLVAAAIGIFLTALDVTVNVALPNITEDLNTDLETVQWIIIFYVGGTTGMQLGLGAAADIYGLKRFFVFGLFTYMLAVFLIGVAPGLGFVLGLRVLQAVGNGLILAAAPAIVTGLFPAGSRGRALGMMAGLGTLGMITGSLGGGVLVDAFGWRAIFLGRLPLCALGIAFALVAVREVKNPGPAQSYDLRGAVTLFIGMASFILFVTLAGRDGWSRPYVLGLVALSVAAMFVFTRIERRAERPILDLALLKHRVLAPALTAAFLVTVATFINWFILPFYVSDVLGASARAWGVLLMLHAVTAALTSPVGGWLSDRAHPSHTITAAMTVSALAMFWFTTLDTQSSLTDVGMRMVAAGLGMGLFQASNANLIMGNFTRDRLGMGGAVMTLSRSLGTVSSVAIMGALFSARQAARSGVRDVADTPIDPPTFVLAFRDLYTVAGVLAALAVVVSFSYWPWAMRRRSR